MIDIGANLTDKSFGGDLDAVLQRAKDAGVERIVLTGSSEPGSKRAAQLADKHPGFLYATAGVHPHLARDYNDGTTEVLRELLHHPKVVSGGECGLDYNRNYSPPDVQRRRFEEQLQLACDLNKPVFLHEREAADDLLEILVPHLPDLPRAVVHCFTGEAATLDRYLEHDLYIGITGWICDERRGSHLIEMMPRIPANRLMIETDAPYLLPRTIRPKPKSRRNEPAFLGWVRDKVAEAAGVSAEELAATTTRTAAEFFALD